MPTVGAVPVSRPVKVARLMIAPGESTMKSSADSISNLPGLLGRDAVAIWLVTDPVEKTNGAAPAGAARHNPAARATRIMRCIEILLSGDYESTRVGTPDAAVNSAGWC